MRRWNQIITQNTKVAFLSDMCAFSGVVHMQSDMALCKTRNVIYDHLAKSAPVFKSLIIREAIVLKIWNIVWLKNHKTSAPVPGLWNPYFLASKARICRDFWDKRRCIKIWSKLFWILAQFFSSSESRHANIRSKISGLPLGPNVLTQGSLPVKVGMGGFRPTLPCLHLEHFKSFGGNQCSATSKANGYCTTFSLPKSFKQWDCLLHIVGLSKELKTLVVWHVEVELDTIDA